ncbi:MAG: hypothetical protein COA73_15555 [Candidatus Hydrogenedentota bacterium]|nr:MAG: hypothetical protein COA73_15555 [Candidatus Hydrogenedentota bacterium]
MMKTITVWSLLSGLLLTTGAVFAQGSLQDRVNNILPSAEEDRFLEIDWRMDLLEARAEANADGKPMFMWMMNGHPFGAT